MATIEKPTDVSPSKDQSVIDWTTELGQIETPPAEQPKAEPEVNPEAEPAAKPTPETKPAPEPKPEPETEDKWPRSAQEWKKFRAARDEGYKKREQERDAIRTQYEAAQKELETFKTKGASPESAKEIEDLKKERDELSERLRLLDVQQHPRFKAYFETKVNRQVEQARQIVGADKAAQVAELLALPESEYRTQQLEALTADLSPMKQGRLFTIVNALGEIEAERQGEISKAKENYSQLQAQREQTSKERDATLRKQFDTMIEQAAKESDVFRARDGDEAWNNNLKTRLDGARELLFGNPPSETVMRSALAAAALPAVISGYTAALEENKKLQEQVKQLSAAQPTVDTTTTKTEGGGAAPVTIRKGSANPMDAANDWLKIIQEPVE